MGACLILSTKIYVYKFLTASLEKSLPLITFLQERIPNNLSIKTRKT